MDPGLQSQQEVPANKLRRQLGAAVQSLQWSYAILWSFSSEKGVLEWGDGFYNGDIKTRKTVSTMELSAEQMGLQRSRQLRDLYEVLSVGDGNQQSKRPCASLSPEDLTDTEWFYMVCMSFVFTPGQGMPGRTCAAGHHIWLCDAHYADSKEFTRSLLAKSAGIQTVVCFPHVDGVLEFGVNELVAEDPSLVQHILTFFPEVSKPACSEQSTFSPQKSNDDDDDRDITNLDSEQAPSMPTEKVGQVVGCKQLAEDHIVSFNSKALKERTDFEHNVANVSHIVIREVASPGNSSNENGPHQQLDDSFMLDELTDTCQVHHWQHVDEETSEGAHGSINSSDCISQSFINNEKLSNSIHNEKLHQYMHQLQECTHSKFNSDTDGNGNSHYSRTLSTILHNSLGLKHVDTSRGFSFESSFSNGHSETGFSRWRKGVSYQLQLIDTPQRLLKKALFEVASLHHKHSLNQEKCHSEDDLQRDENLGGGHILSEERRREKLNEQFIVLRSFVPSINKFLQLDKASLLGDTIEYLKELERKVEELETFKELVGRKRYPDVAERTSDNYANTMASKKHCKAERNASTCNEPKSEIQWVLCKDSITDVMVTVTEADVAVEIQCPWRESLLLEIVQAMNELQLDSQSVESSIVDSIFKLSLKAKVWTTLNMTAS
ncbi:Transcription factor GLABRA 3 [Nymphaea thermarum]|nr:Transcription factor GLABRA 3 [Nymphaea thermarum]